MQPSPPLDSFNVVVCGDVGTGKSSILDQLVRRVFFENRSATPGVDTKPIEVKGVRLQLHDIAGHLRGSSAVEQFFRRCDAVLIVGSLDNELSIDHIAYWIDETKRIASKYAAFRRFAPSDPHTLPWYTFFVVNKIDLVPLDDYRRGEYQVKSNEANCDGCFFTSAKDYANIQSVFEQVAETLKAAGVPSHRRNPHPPIVPVDPPPVRKPKKKNCAC
jgi:GTPase SAR1 family protein